MQYLLTSKSCPQCSCHGWQLTLVKALELKLLFLTPLTFQILFMLETREKQRESERFLNSLRVSGVVFHQENDSCIEAINWRKSFW